MSRSMIRRFYETVEFLKSSPDSDGYGGGTKDKRLFDRLSVFASTLESQLRKFFVDIKVNLIMRNRGDLLSYEAVVSVSYKGNSFTVLTLTGRIGGSCSGKSFGKIMSKLGVKDLNMGLVNFVVSGCVAKIEGGFYGNS